MFTVECANGEIYVYETLDGVDDDPKNPAIRVLFESESFIKNKAA